MDVLAVHNYNLKKKTFSCVAIGRNDNYDLKKKDTDVWRVHNYVQKKMAQSSGHQWEWLGGFQELRCFGGFIIYVRKKEKAQSSGHQWEWLGGFHELGCFGRFIITI